MRRGFVVLLSDSFLLGLVFPVFFFSLFFRAGVWDVISSQEAVDMTLASESIDAAAKLIVDTATQRRSMDNITALIIDTRHFRGRKKM